MLAARHYLIEQRREGVEIVAVNEYHLETSLVEVFYQIEAGETASDYHYTLFCLHTFKTT